MIALHNLSNRATHVMRDLPLQVAVRDGLITFEANEYVASGGMGEEYRSKTDQWLSGALADLCDKMKTTQDLPDDEAYESAMEEWEELLDNDEDAPEPIERNFTKPALLKFGVGMMGSVWFDVDLTGTVDGHPVTKKTRVSLDPRRQIIDGDKSAPIRVVLDATFDDKF